VATDTRTPMGEPTSASVANEPQLAVTLEAKAGADVRLEDFAGYLEDLRGALNAVDRHVAFNTSSTTFYTISGLTKASPATVVLEAHARHPGIDHRNAVFATLVSTLAAIGENGLQSPERPPTTDIGMLYELKPLVDRMAERGRLARVRISYGHTAVALTQESSAKMMTLLGREQYEIGSVRDMADLVALVDKFDDAQPRKKAGRKPKSSALPDNPN